MSTDNEIITKTYLRSVMNEDIDIYDTSPLSHNELMWAIRDAIIEEQNAIKIYENIAIRASNSKVKNLLQDIANEEKVHIGELQELLETISPQEDGFIDDGRKESKNLLKGLENEE